MRACKTCTKKFLSGRGCKVLAEMIGEKQECWAWSDDPDWERKVKKAIQAYSDRLKEGS